MTTELNLGALVVGDAQRDAIHIAVVPMIAGEALLAGQHVGFVERGTGRVVAACDSPIGVVDPFLRTPVRQGERFWLFLYPNTITSLRHEWTHPALDGSEAVQSARKVITGMAERMGLSCDALMVYAAHHAKGWDDGYVTQQGDESWRDFFHGGTFWPAYQLVTGEVVAPDKQDDFFSCSC